MFFLSSIQSVFSIFLIIGLGYYLEKKHWFDENFNAIISNLITKVALPASIFVSVLKHINKESLLGLGTGLLYPIVSTAALYIVAMILAWVCKISVKRRGVFINAIANSNMVFIGLPLSIALFGDKGLSFYLLCYIINTLSTWTLGMYFISRDNPANWDEKAEMKINLKRLLPPPLVGFLIAVGMIVMGISVPLFIKDTCTHVGNLVTSLSLMYIGIMLRRTGIMHIRFNKDMSVPLLCRFIVSPLITFAMLMLCINVVGIELPLLLQQTLWIQAGTPMLVVLPILASEYNGDVEYATDLVTSSTLMFIGILPIMIKLMGILL